VGVLFETTFNLEPDYIQSSVENHCLETMGQIPTVALISAPLVVIWFDHNAATTILWRWSSSNSESSRKLVRRTTLLCIFSWRSKRCASSKTCSSISTSMVVVVHGRKLFSELIRKIVRRDSVISLQPDSKSSPIYPAHRKCVDFAVWTSIEFFWM